MQTSFFQSRETRRVERRILFSTRQSHGADQLDHVILGRITCITQRFRLERECAHASNADTVATSCIVKGQTLTVRAIELRLCLQPADDDTLADERQSLRSRAIPFG